MVDFGATTTEDMNKESLNIWLAIKVMNWNAVPLKLDWDTTTNISHAMMCLDTFEWYSICKNDDTYAEKDKPYSCEVSPDEVCGHVAVAESLPMAISLACAKATGWSE